MVLLYQKDKRALEYQKPQIGSYKRIKTYGIYNVKEVPTQEITMANIIDSPILVSSKIETEPGNLIELTFDMEMKGGVKERFTVKVGSNLSSSVSRNVTAFEINASDNKRVNLTIDGAKVTNQRKYLLVIISDSTNGIQSKDDSLEVVLFTDSEVVNNIAPRITISEFNNQNKNKLILNFDVDAKASAFFRFIFINCCHRCYFKCCC